MQPTQPADTDADVAFLLSGDPAPKPRTGRKRKKRPVLGFGPRVAIIAVAAVFAAVCLCAVVSKAVQPYRMQHVQAAHIRQLKAQLGATEAENSDLQDRITALQRPDGVETEARSHGYVKPGEVSLDITAQQPPAAPVSERPGLAGVLSRAFHSLTGR